MWPCGDFMKWRFKFIKSSLNNISKKPIVYRNLTTVDSTIKFNDISNKPDQYDFSQQNYAWLTESINAQNTITSTAAHISSKIEIL